MGWDRNLDYEKTRRLLERELDGFKRRGDNRGWCYTAILLTQLTNGSRVGEAVSFFYIVIKEGKKEARIRLEKQKKERTRLMRLPSPLTPRQVRDRCSFLLYVDREKAKARVKMFAKRRFGFNTHSLRYALVTYLAKQGYPPNLIARITGHRNLNHLITYTQEKAAEGILRNLTK